MTCAAICEAITGSHRLRSSSIPAAASGSQNNVTCASRTQKPYPVTSESSSPRLGQCAAMSLEQQSETSFRQSPHCEIDHPRTSWYIPSHHSPKKTTTQNGMTSLGVIA